MASVKRRIDNKQWLSSVQKRIFGASTVLIILWLTSAFYAPVFFFGFSGGDEANPNVVSSAGLAVLTSVVVATVIAVIAQVVLSRRALRRSF